MADNENVPAKLSPRDMIKNLSLGQMISLGIIALAGITLIFSVFFYAAQEEMSPLYKNLLDAKTQKQIQGELDRRDIVYEVSSKGRILVPKSRVLELQTDFEAMDITPGGKTGMSVMDEANPLKSGEYMMKLKAQQALALDISRMLQEHPNVMKAEVRIVPAKDSPFADQTEPAKASVMLRLRNHSKLTTGQVEGMQQMVAAAIDRAEAQDIIITNQFGDMLSRTPADDSAIGLSNSNLETKARMERDYERKIHQIMETFLGREKARARVSMDVDFSQIQTVEKQFGGPDAEGERQLYNEQNKTETIVREGGAGDAVGTAANTAQGGIPTQGNGQAGSQIDRDTKTNQYFVDEKQTTTRVQPYKVGKLSVALQLDYRTVETVQGEPSFFAKLTSTEADWIKVEEVALDTSEMGRVRELVEAAVGFDEERGDSISIQNFPFRPAMSKKAMASAETGQLLEYLKKWTPTVLQVIIFILFVMWGISLFRRFVAPILQQAQLEEPALSAALPSGPPKTVAELESELEQEIEATSPSAQLSKSEIMKKRIIEMVQQDPESVSSLVRTWLLEDD